uniref:Link domain-containing protein n=1 Tax=Cyprinus carpio TaxID=7962 RepID=A0A8C2AEX2_CYPCA
KWCPLLTAAWRTTAAATPKPLKTAGVFHLRSSEGKYKLNFSQAQEACKAEGATLATFKQLSDAQQV